MSDSATHSSTIAYGSYHDPYYISNSDHSSQSLVTNVFNGSNFSAWSRNIRRALIAKYKLGFITGSLPKPDPSHKDYDAWLRCDYLVTSWLLSSMSSDISENFVYVDSSQDLWFEISERYGHYTGPQIYQLKKELNNLRQENMTLVAYFIRLKRFWDEIKSIRSFPTCSCGAIHSCTCNLLKRIADFEEEERLMQFLLGLNENFDGVITNLLSMAPLPTVNRAYYLAQQVESQKEVSAGTSSVTEVSALNAMKVPSHFKQLTAQKNSKVTSDVSGKDWRKDKGDRTCDFCKRKGHLKDTCWKLHGFPDWYLAKKGKKFAANASLENSNNLLESPFDLDANGEGLHSNSSTATNNGVKSTHTVIADSSSDTSGSVEGCSASVNNKVDLRLFHARLGHASLSRMQHTGVCHCTGVKDFFCDICVCAKHHKSSFQKSASRALACFDLVHIDLWGPYRHKTYSGASYFLTIVDDYSRCTWTHLLNNKKQVFGVVSSFIAMAKTQFHKDVKVIRSDNGTELVQDSCLTLFNEKGILHQRSIVGVPQQNGRVERKHKHLLEIARALRFQSNVPIRFWGDCLLTATYLINLIPTPILNCKSPSEVLFGVSPKYDNLRVFGSLCFAHNIHTKGDKFAPKAVKCIFIGYPFGQKGYKVFNLEDKKSFITRDAVFQEHVFPYKTQLEPLPNTSSTTSKSIALPIINHDPAPDSPSNSFTSTSNSPTNILTQATASAPISPINDPDISSVPTSPITQLIPDHTSTSSHFPEPVNDLSQSLGYPFSLEEEENGVVQKIIDLCSFESLTSFHVNAASTLRSNVPGLNVQNNSFFRKGQIGDHKNYMTDEMADRLKQITNLKLVGSGLEVFAA
ncbi:Retrovirus-related Pol polyprotein from transposon TNT 1-94 [Bienertia sinuspersici]